MTKGAVAGNKRRNSSGGEGDGEFMEGLSIPLPPGLANASKNILQRVRALKKLQLETLDLEASFYKRVHELEKEFEPLFAQVNEKRKQIVKGAYDPSASECDVKLLEYLDEEELKKIEDEAPIEGGMQFPGIPGFWLGVLKESNLAEIIQECDFPILHYLEDISVELHSDPAGFTLNFHFSPENPNFTNSVLKKYYQLEINVDRSDSPFDYEGPKVVKCQGTEIDWKPNMDVTKRLVQKQVKKGLAAENNFETKTVSQASFFNFFSPPATQFSLDMDPEVEADLVDDFEYGQEIRHHVIPRAVLFLTGEANQGEDDEDLMDDYGDDEEEENESFSDMDADSGQD